MNSHLASNDAALERKARNRWTGMIVGLFLTQMALWSLAIIEVSDDPSHAVVPNYAEKAVAWDDHVAALRRSRGLGWHADLGFRHAVDGGSEVAVSLTDHEGHPVMADAVTLSLFHQARAGDRQQLELRAVGPGEYAAAIPEATPGSWRLELDARRGDDRFLLETIETVAPAGG